MTVVLCCALDRFSVVDFGPELGAGDQVLCHYAALLTSLAGPNDTPARLGGDEFALLCLADTVAGAVGLAERLCTISAPGQPLGPPIMTASVGLAVAEPASTARQLLRDAQAAMRHAKHNGRHRIEVFEPVMRSAAVERAVRHEWLRDALASDALELHFQPIIDSSTGHIVAAEALIRGRLDNGELLMPNQFLPVAYRMGLALELDAWVLDHALDTVQRWYARYGAATPAVSINLSSQQLTRRDLSQDILDRLEQRRLPRSLVWLEVTETAIAGAQDRGVQSLHELRSAGIELAIDDFGTGASSLGRLRDLPFTLLKIDRSFVAALPGLLRDESIVTAIGELASALGMEIIAEGVEHTNQLNALRRAGCSWLQGFLFSKPVVEASLLSRLDNPDPAWSWALGLR